MLINVGRCVSRVSGVNALSLRLASTYESNYCLNTIYPSNKDSVPLALKVRSEVGTSATFNGYIPMEQLTVTYSKGSGPGGQHVNKCKSQVEVRFVVEKSDWIQEDVRRMLIDKYKHRLTNDGHLVVKSHRTRIASLNLADCLDKIRQTVKSCQDTLQQQNAQPSPETLKMLEQRKPRASTKRLKEKRIASQNRRMMQSDV